MDLWTIVKVVVRRWWAVVPVLVATAFVAYQVAYKAPPMYQANGSALLVSPNVATGTTGLPVKQNPYLLFSGSLNITASALVRILNDSSVRDGLVEDGLVGDYEIGVEQNTPTIGITAEGKTPEVVIETVRRLLNEVGNRLRNLQNEADAPSDLRIGIELLVEPSTASTLRGQVARTMATIGVLGVLAGVGLALLIEAAASARRRTKAERRVRSEQERQAAGPVPTTEPVPGQEQLGKRKPVPANNPVATVGPVTPPTLSRQDGRRATSSTADAGSAQDQTLESGNDSTADLPVSDPEPAATPPDDGKELALNLNPPGRRTFRRKVSE